MDSHSSWQPARSSKCHCWSPSSIPRGWARPFVSWTSSMPVPIFPRPCSLCWWSRYVRVWLISSVASPRRWCFSVWRWVMAWVRDWFSKMTPLPHDLDTRLCGADGLRPGKWWNRCLAGGRLLCVASQSGSGLGLGAPASHWLQHSNFRECDI